MKKIYIVILVLISNLAIAQNEFNYEITVLDSFTCVEADQEGMTALSSVKYNNRIHIAYFMQDTGNIKELRYATRTNSIFSSERVAVLPNTTQWGFASTAMQFDKFGNPIIYASYLKKTGEKEIHVYRKNGNSWNGNFVANLGASFFMVADPDASEEMGFVYTGVNDPAYKPSPIIYASYNGSNWDFTTISNTKFHHRTKPSIIRYHDKLYVAYGEGRCQDTLITMVHVKDKTGWHKSLEDVNLTVYNCGSIAGLYTKLGRSESGLHLISDLRRSEGHPTHFILSNNSWNTKSIDCPHSLTASISSPNIRANNENILFWLNQNNGFGPRLSFIKPNGSGSHIELPHQYYAYWLFDFVILDNHAYIYYFEGSVSWPYGTPVTFKEIRVDLPSIFTDIEEIDNKLQNINLYQNFPNPFYRDTEIKFALPKSSLVHLQLYNSNGRIVNTLLSGKYAAGEHVFTLRGAGLTPGVYYYTLNVGNQIITKKFILSR